MGPGASVEERAELPAPLRILVLVVAERLLDLPRMLIRRHLPLGVFLHNRRVGDPKLLGQVFHHQPRHIQRISEEQPYVAHRAHLHREPEVRVRAATLVDQATVLVIQEEEPLQLRTRRLHPERPVRLRLLIGQKLHRHRETVYTSP